MWSCGVILYIMLTGSPPFNGDNESAILKRVSIGTINYYSKELETVSSEAISLLKKLLTFNPKKRITAAMALEEPWIKQVFGESKIINGISNKTIEKLKNFTVFLW